MPRWQSFSGSLLVINEFVSLIFSIAMRGLVQCFLKRAQTVIVTRDPAMKRNFVLPAALVAPAIALALTLELPYGSAWAQPPASPIIVNRASSDIFPPSWLAPGVGARAELLAETEQQRSVAVITKALGKYPSSLISANVTHIYVLGRLEYSGVAAGGTNSKTDVYVVKNGRISDALLENNFHAEFSSILLRNFPQHLDTEAWQRVHSPDFHYRGSGVQAIKSQQASVRLSDSLHEEGFLNEYAKASVEEDFNSFAARLFTGDPLLWRAIDRYPKVRAKAELAMAFYRKLDASFTKEFFASLRQTSESLMR